MSRQEIIEIGDGLNKAIFTPDEIEGGTARLVAAGYAIKNSDETLSISESGKELVSQAALGSKGLVSTMFAVIERICGPTN